ncbi:CLUMA_CG020238, isoform A [Clunio marinus]|uniref:CLUMA_CG015238, isoform A n=1 Tax=Clunio marinus TaxID=568069 RepID=A0A1J1J5M0_9DIPT|nr:CLUMA_CG015238, isoform A [Clunio marinus]CRL07258.1 CLUMA_CG020238, isoform A [Clunio marinus]
MNTLKSLIIRYPRLTDIFLRPLKYLLIEV